MVFLVVFISIHSLFHTIHTIRAVRGVVRAVVRAVGFGVTVSSVVVGNAAAPHTADLDAPPHHLQATSDINGRNVVDRH